MDIESPPNLLTVIVPISRMAGRLDLMTSWLSNCTLRPISVVLVHDEQDSETSRELESLIPKLKNPDIRLITGIFNGPGLARNIGMQFVTTDWVAFWDSDDFPEVEAILNELWKAQPDVDALIGGFNAFTKNEFENRKTDSSSNHEVMSYFSIFLNPGIWRWVFRAEKISSITFPPYKLAEDQSFLLEFMYCHPKLMRTPTIFYNYIVGQSSSLTSGLGYISDLKDAARQNFRRAFQIFDVVSLLGIAVSLRIFLTYIKRISKKIIRVELRHDS